MYTENDEQMVLEDTQQDCDVMPSCGTKSGQYSLANFNVTTKRSGESVSMENIIGPGFLGDTGYNEEEEEAKRKERRDRRSSNRNKKGKASTKSRILQEAIGSLYPDVEDPGEAMRLARAFLNKGGEDEFLIGETSMMVAPGKEKIGPGNDHDDLPVFVKNIVDFIVKPELETARYMEAQRTGNKKIIRQINDKRREITRRRRRCGIGSSQASTVIFGNNESKESSCRTDFTKSRIFFGGH